MALLPDGQLRQAITYGDNGYGMQIRVKRFMLGPDGAVYIVFEWPVFLGESASPGQPPPQCVLVRVDRGTGGASCVDSDLNQVSYWQNFGSGMGLEYEPVQFDGDGSIYYLGHKWGVDSSGTVLRRKSANGTFTDLVPTGNVSVNSFVVTEGGSVLMNGSNQGGGTPWLRRVSPEGGLKTLSVPGHDQYSWSGFSLMTLSDDRTYVSPSYGATGLFPYDDASRELLTQPWIGPAAANPDHSFEDFCTSYGPGASQDWPGMCSSAQLPAGALLSTSNRDFIISADGRVVQIQPTLEGSRTSLAEVTEAEMAGSRIILAGKETGMDTVIAFNLNTDQETVLVPPQDEIEVYNLQFSPSGNSVFFDGLRFGDNSYVFGEIDLASGTYSAEKASTGKWQQFQVFG